MTKKYKNMGGSGTHSSCTPAFYKIMIAGKPVKDFPCQGQFQTVDELEAYFNDDKLQCLECGLSFKLLAQHISTAHNMTRQDYNNKYGIPKGRGLVPNWWKEKASSNKKKQFAENPEYLKLCMKHLTDNLHKIKPRGKETYGSAVDRDRMSRLRAVANKKVETSCVDCSIRIFKRLSTIKAGQARCDTCYSEHILKSKRDWYHKSKDNT